MQARVDTFEKRPAAHFVHDYAPRLARVSLTDPGPHVEQLLAPAVLYVPATHAMQSDASSLPVTPM
jgi:hypothetical protein